MRLKYSNAKIVSILPREMEFNEFLDPAKIEAN
jgi:hypothetical protein